MELTGFNTLTYDLLKYLIEFDLEIAIMLCQSHPQYRSLLIRDEKLWRNYFDKTWFPLRPKDNAHAKCIKFLHNLIPINYKTFKLDWISDWSNIVISGNYVTNAVIKDYDAMDLSRINIFFINNKLTKEDVVKKIQQLHSWMSTKYIIDKIHVVNKTVSIRGHYVAGGSWYMSLTIEINFTKLFGSIYELITSFIIPNKAFAYDNNKIYYTESALDWYRTRIIYYYNPGNCPKRNKCIKTYEERFTIQPIKKKLFDCALNNVIDYHEKPLVQHRNVSIHDIGQYITL